jgi:hypothetical protein
LTTSPSALRSPPVILSPSSLSLVHNCSITPRQIRNCVPPQFEHFGRDIQANLSVCSFFITPNKTPSCFSNIGTAFTNIEMSFENSDSKDHNSETGTPLNSPDIQGTKISNENSNDHISQPARLQIQRTPKHRDWQL